MRANVIQLSVIGGRKRASQLDMSRHVYSKDQKQDHTPHAHTGTLPFSWQVSKVRARRSGHTSLHITSSRMIVHSRAPSHIRSRSPRTPSSHSPPERFPWHSCRPVRVGRGRGALPASRTEALDWLFTNHLARAGTVIGYDDWWTIPCWNFRRTRHRLISSPLLVGEGLAHAEIARRHGVVFRCIAGPCKAPPSVRRAPAPQRPIGGGASFGRWGLALAGVSPLDLAWGSGADSRGGHGPPCKSHR